MKKNFKLFIDYFQKEKIQFKYENIHYYKNNNFKNNKNNRKLLINFTFRHIFFFKLVAFLKKNNLEKKKFLNILYTYQNFLWYIFLQTKNLIYYYYLIKAVLRKYKKLYFLRNFQISSDDSFVINQNDLNNFNNYLNFFNLNDSSILKIKENDLKKFHSLFLKNLEDIKNLKLKLNQNFFLNFYDLKKKNFNKSKFLISFLRVQKRYNKRRYSKVRVVSRSSFFAGISLSSIFLALLWGGSIKSVDWLSTKIVVIDINLFIFILIIYYIFRLWRVFFLNTFLREQNKIKLFTNLHKMFIFHFWINNDWKKK